MILNNKSLIEARYEDEWTALMLAADWGNDAMVRMLLRLGADSTAENRDGLTSRQIAADSGYPEVADIISRISRAERR